MDYDPRAILMENKLNKLLGQVINAENYPKTAVFQPSMINCWDNLLPSICYLKDSPDNNVSETA